MKTVSEQIRDLEATRAAKAARMQEVMQKSLAEGRSSDEAEAEEFDTLDTEIKQLDSDLVRLKKLESLMGQQAKPLSETGSVVKSGNGTGVPYVHVRSSDQEEKFKGQNFVRQVIAKAAARLEEKSPSVIAYERWGKTNPTLVNIIKANEVAGGGTGSGEWGAELVTANNQYTGDFVEFLYARTVYDQLPLRRVPANVMIKGQDGASTGYWVGESKAIPATTADFFNVTLTPHKVAALAVVSNDLIRYASPDAEMLVRDSLVEASAQRIDSTFLSTAAAVAGVSPAGILNGLTAVTTAGNDADGVREDIKALYAGFLTARNARDLAYIMSPTLAKSAGLMRNALSQGEFPGLGANGGTLEGDQVYTGDNVNAAHVILLRPADIYRIGDDGVEVSVSREAMIEQSSAPTGATDTPMAVSQAFNSMFQTDSSAIRVIRRISFAKRRASAVAYIAAAAWGTPPAP